MKIVDQVHEFKITVELNVDDIKAIVYGLSDITEAMEVKEGKFREGTSYHVYEELTGILDENCINYYVRR